MTIMMWLHLWACIQNARRNSLGLNLEQNSFEEWEVQEQLVRADVFVTEDHSQENKRDKGLKGGEQEMELPSQQKLFTSTPPEGCTS